MRIRTLSFIWLAAILALTTAFRIDHLNERAGFILPRTGELRDDGGLVKWRVMARPSSPTELAESRLRSVVGTWGVAQYPILLVSLPLSIMLAAWPQVPRLTRVFAIAAAIALSYAASRAWTLGYLASLAW